jgi:hypothetical protein
MTNHDLPDDLSQWPVDPFLVLGLKHAADATEARRAYVRLIRHFKPEHAPEHFQRVREAYEFVQRQIEVRERYGDLWSDAGDDADQADDDRAEFSRASDFDAPADSSPEDFALSTESETVGEQMPPSLRSPRSSRSSWKSRPFAAAIATGPEEQCAEIWQSATNGDEAGAYARLLALRGQQERGHPEICVRLYWLLTARPQLDPERQPCDWLADGLRASALAGPLAELYRRELADNPREAISERCNNLLSVNATAGALADLVQWRWRACGLIEEWNVIVRDLPQIRDRVVFDDEDTWGRLLLIAIDQLAWADREEAHEAVQACRHEIEQLSHVHSSLSDHLDRMDLLFEVAEGYRRIRYAVHVPAEWIKLIPLSWTQPFEEIRARLMPVLQNMAQDPLAALKTFGLMAGHSPAAAAQLGHLIERCHFQEIYYHQQHEREWDEVRDAVQRFLRLHPGYYRQLRQELLQFCVSEAIDPEWLGQIADESPHAWKEDNISWLDTIREDGPMRYVYLAYRTFCG